MAAFDPILAQAAAIAAMRQPPRPLTPSGQRTFYDVNPSVPT